MWLDRKGGLCFDFFLVKENALLALIGVRVMELEGSVSVIQMRNLEVEKPRRITVCK
jgi:hypothetical protein